MLSFRFRMGRATARTLSKAVRKRRFLIRLGTVTAKDYLCKEDSDALTDLAAKTAETHCALGLL